MTHRSIRWFPIAAALSVTACDAMSNDEYRGTPLLGLHGTISDRRAAVSSHATLPPELNVYLVWDPDQEYPNEAEPLGLLPTFPATFRLDVFNPPALASREQWAYLGADGDRLTLGHFVAAAPGTEFWEILGYPAQRRETGIFGVDPRHVLYYMPDGIAEGTNGAAVLHGAQPPGFHMYEIRCIGPAKRVEIEACLAPFPPNDSVEGDARFLLSMQKFRACGTINPDMLWMQPAPDDLHTELTVELLDNLPDEGHELYDCL